MNREEVLWLYRFYAIIYIGGDDMQKEKLTIQNIQTDLRKLLKDRYVELIEIALVLLFFVAVLLWVPVVFYKVVFGCFAAIMLCLVVFQVLDIIKLHKVFDNTDCIVKDKMVSKEIRRYMRIRNRGYFRLHFSSYGTYMIPDESYSWSSMFSMLHKKVYESSNYGDEFYLVLLKQHKGEILFAYNTKMFEFEE